MRAAMKFVRAIALAFPCMAAAQNLPPGYPAITLEEAVETALVNNRQLQIERINPELARLTLKASYGYYDPFFTTQVQQESASDTGGFDPANFSADAIYEADSEVVNSGLTGFLPSGLSYTLGGTYAHSDGTRNFLNFDSHKVGVNITVSQPLLKNFWIDLPRWQIQVNKRNLKISELGVEYVAATVISLAEQGYHDLVYAWEYLRVQQALLGTRQEFLRGIRRQIELGMMTALDEKLARSQAASIETALVAASNVVAQASNNLQTLMGIEEMSWSDVPLKPESPVLLVPQIFDRPASWREGLRKRADFRQLAINLQNAELTVKYRRNQLFPSLNLIGSYGLRGADAIQAFPPDEPRASRSAAFREIHDQDAPNSMVGVLFSIPLTRTSERANFKASKELERQAELLLKQKEELILREIADAIDLARFSFERARSAREAAAAASEAQEAEEQRLQGGAGSIFLVLQAQTDAANSKIAELLAKRDYNKALSQLYFNEGTLLERKSIELNFRGD